MTEPKRRQRLITAALLLSVALILTALVLVVTGHGWLAFAFSAACVAVFVPAFRAMRDCAPTDLDDSGCDS